MAKYLDATGLSYFWEKIKSWVQSFIANGVNTEKVGKTTDGAYLDFGDEAVALAVQHTSNYKTTDVVLSKDGIRFTSLDNTHVLLGGGGTRQLGAAGGIPTLDSNGKIPLSQLGNLDTTVAEVVTALPESDIKKHIYLVRASSTKTNNIYKEYLYTGDTSATYDASKWEQLGEYKTDIDLTPYAKAADLASHTGNKNNPHQVTKAQVGLGNVDNTSDKNKPVSTAQKEALDGKVDKVTGKGLSSNDYTKEDKAIVDSALTKDGGHLNDGALLTFGDIDESDHYGGVSGEGFVTKTKSTGTITQYRDGEITLLKSGVGPKLIHFPSPAAIAVTLLTNEDVGAIPTTVIDALS